ncbi:hypothetical protein VPH35_029696 [Triticum aestivum]
MNGRFPEATAHELNSDVTCIICCEETTTTMKLLCGHLFHVHCLRSWRERQHTCLHVDLPLPPDNGRAPSAGQHEAQLGVSLVSLLFFCRHRCSRFRRSNKQERCYISKEDSSSKTLWSLYKKMPGVQVLCENDAPVVFWKNGKITWLSDCKHIGHCLCGVQFIKTS